MLREAVTPGRPETCPGPHGIDRTVTCSVHRVFECPRSCMDLILISILQRKPAGNDGVSREVLPIPRPWSDLCLNMPSGRRESSRSVVTFLSFCDYVALSSGKKSDLFLILWLCRFAWQKNGLDSGTYRPLSPTYFANCPFTSPVSNISIFNPLNSRIIIIRLDF